MSEYLKITKEGQLLLYRHNPDRCGVHRCKNKDDKYLVINRVSKEIVATFETEKEQDNFFYDVADIEISWKYLRSNIYLEDGVTLGNIISVIENDKSLNFLTGTLFPCFPHVGYVDEDSDPAEVLIIRQYGMVENNFLTLQYDFGWKNTRTFVEGTIVEIDQNFTIYKDGEYIPTGLRIPSLLDLIQALFGTPNDFDPCSLTENGVSVNGILSDDSLSNLMRPCTLSEDLTLGDVFNYVKNHEVLCDFIRFYSWCGPIDEFHKQAELPPVKDDHAEKIWHLEIYRSLDVWDGPYSFVSFEPEFGGIGELCGEEKKFYDENPDKPRPNHTNYGIDMTPMNNVAGLSVILDVNLEVYRHSTKANGYRGNLEAVETYHTTYSLLDILDAIYWEISFYGGPEESQALGDELAEEIREIKEALASGDQDQIISFEDWLEEDDEDE